MIPPSIPILYNPALYSHMGYGDTISFPMIIPWIISGVIAFAIFYSQESYHYPDLDAPFAVLCVVGGPIYLVIAVLQLVFTWSKK